MNKILLMISLAALLFSFGACNKQEEQPVSKGPAPRGPIMDSKSAPPGHGTPGKKTEVQIVIPRIVKEQWTQVTIILDDKKENKKQELTLNIGDEFKIPDSKLTIQIGPFLPDFKMTGSVITSSSNIPNNSAVGFAIMEDGKKIFPPSGKWGWLYAKFPDAHSFQHERYGLTLKEGIK